MNVLAKADQLTESRFRKVEEIALSAQTVLGGLQDREGVSIEIRAGLTWGFGVGLPR